MVNLKGNNYFKFVGLALLFFFFLFDKEMAYAYMAILLVDLLWKLSDRKESYPLTKKVGNFTESLVVAIGAYAVFLVINMVSINLIKGSSITFSQSISTMSSLPILAGSTAMTVVGWALIIPIVETTFFFGRLLEGGLDTLQLRLNKKIDKFTLTKYTILMCLIISTIFTIFHSKIDLAPIVTVFVFGMISCILVIKDKQILSAILLHILANGAALAVKFGVL